MIDVTEDIRIRPERSDEWGLIYQVVRDAFSRKEEADLVEKLRHCPEFIPKLSLVALFHGGIIGYILFTDLYIKDGNQAVRSLALAPIAVHPSWQRKGIGSAMVNAGMKGCRLLGYEYIVVVGDPAFYSRFGFSPARAYGLICPFPVPDEVFMAMELVPGVLAGKGGTVKYADPFNVQQ